MLNQTVLVKKPITKVSQRYHKGSHTTTRQCASTSQETRTVILNCCHRSKSSSITNGQTWSHWVPDYPPTQRLHLRSHTHLVTAVTLSLATNAAECTLALNWLAAGNVVVGVMALKQPLPSSYICIFPFSEQPWTAHVRGQHTGQATLVEFTN